MTIIKKKTEKQKTEKKEASKKQKARKKDSSNGYKKAKSGLKRLRESRP
ncbi:MAG: hypothetical protein PF542_00830 [Nanoarchaeota archaeon]|jgi:hypothetical protein|nr:hypothetical protein [Nanoarchaeota archaeon]